MNRIVTNFNGDYISDELIIHKDSDSKDKKLSDYTQKHFMSIMSNDHRQQHGAWVDTEIINMHVICAKGNLTLVGNSVKIGKNINAITISGGFSAGDFANGDISSYISKNNIEFTRAYAYKPDATYYVALTVPTITIAVAEGDLITLKCGGASSENIRYLYSYLSVVAI